jgi:cell division transport system permease protein
VLKVGGIISVVCLIGVLLLLIASTLLIANTIRLSIFARRREIEVMKLVGATNWFVRGPFMVEGLICGLAGSIAAVVLLVIGKSVVLPSIGLHHSKDAHAMAFELNALILIAIGLALGVSGTGLTLRRFLQV